MGGLSVQTYHYYNEQFKSASVAACIGRARILYVHSINFDSVS